MDDNGMIFLYDKDQIALELFTSFVRSFFSFNGLRRRAMIRNEGKAMATPLF